MPICALALVSVWPSRLAGRGGRLDERACGDAALALLMRATPPVRSSPEAPAAMSATRTPATGTPAEPGTATPGKVLLLVGLMTLDVSTMTAVFAGSVEPP